MVVRRMSSKDARANFSELLGLVYYTQEPVIVERKGKPYAVVISPKQWERIQQEQQRAWARIDDLREQNADQDPDAVLADVTEVVEQVRQERYEREHKARPRSR
jgi:prevent-host-death family protein